MTANKTLTAIEALLQFAVHNGLAEAEDVVFIRNRLFELLRVEPEAVDQSLFNVPDARAAQATVTGILRDLLDDYAARGFLPEDTVTRRDLLEAAIMGLCMPRPSETARVYAQKHTESPVAATDYFYHLCRACNYIQVDRIGKNLYWQTGTDYGDLEITVNLSKPEKDPRDIAAARTAQTAAYPRCLLCLENTGFAGTMALPPRQNLRTIPVTLDGEPWYFQYSPYVYYNEHCIVFNEKHVPMRLTESTFRKLIAFVGIFPHYFIGSNADLPIVGGSILSHDHFQGGRHVFPMERAKTYADYRSGAYPKIKISPVKWPMTAVRLRAETYDEETKAQMTALAVRLLETWRGWNAPEAEVLAFSGETPHNTVTPIVRRRTDGGLEMDMVLRNNRTSAEHPLGIFHPHSQWHHIKKENIGLIEVMGLAILPGRLKKELEAVAKLLAGQNAENPAAAQSETAAAWQTWIDGLLARYGERNTPENAARLINDEVGAVFGRVLADCGVFKDNTAGRAQLQYFIEKLGFSAC